MEKTIRAEKPICASESCESPAITKGWCSKHYQRWKIYGDPNFVRKEITSRPKNGRVCRIPDCGEPVKAKGLCSMHHQRWLRTGDTERLRKPPTF